MKEGRKAHLVGGARLVARPPRAAPWAQGCPRNVTPPPPPPSPCAVAVYRPPRLPSLLCLSRRAPAQVASRGSGGRDASPGWSTAEPEWFSFDPTRGPAHAPMGCWRCKDRSRFDRTMGRLRSPDHPLPVVPPSLRRRRGSTGQTRSSPPAPVSPHSLPIRRSPPPACACIAAPPPWHPAGPRMDAFVGRRSATQIVGPPPPPRAL